jgi:hypothetical protein
MTSLEWADDTVKVRTRLLPIQCMACAALSSQDVWLD